MNDMMSSIKKYLKKEKNMKANSISAPYNKPLEEILNKPLKDIDIPSRGDYGSITQFVLDNAQATVEGRNKNPKRYGMIFERKEEPQRRPSNSITGELKRDAERNKDKGNGLER